MALDSSPHALVLRYRDPANSSEWLCKALGFSRTHIDCDDEGNFRYARLRFGNALIMVGRIGDAGFDDLMAQPDELGGAVTNIPYFVVDDLDAHYAHARAAGAAMAIELGDYNAGGRGYTCRDPEGHAWSFGSYNPWIADGSVPSRQRQTSKLGRFSGVAALVIGVLSVVVASGWLPTDSLRGDTAPEAIDRTAQLTAEITQALGENEVMREALVEAAQRETAERSALRFSEERLRALVDQVETAAAAMQARDEAVASLQRQIEATKATKVELDARAKEAEASLSRERERRALAEKQTNTTGTAFEEQQRQHRASQEAAREQYNALAAKLAATEHAHRVALSSYEELVSERASSTIGAKPPEAERLAPPARSQPDVRGAMSKREAKSVATRSASTVEPRWDRARRRCAEVRRNPDDYEPELVQLCRAL